MGVASALSRINIQFGCKLLDLVSPSSFKKWKESLSHKGCVEVKWGKMWKYPKLQSTEKIIIVIKWSDNYSNWNNKKKYVTCIMLNESKQLWFYAENGWDWNFNWLTMCSGNELGFSTHRSVAFERGLKWNILMFLTFMRICTIILIPLDGLFPVKLAIAVIPWREYILRWHCALKQGLVGSVNQSDSVNQLYSHIVFLVAHFYIFSPRWERYNRECRIL